MQNVSPARLSLSISFILQQKLAPNLDLLLKTANLANRLLGTSDTRCRTIVWASNSPRRQPKKRIRLASPASCVVVSRPQSSGPLGLENPHEWNSPPLLSHGRNNRRVRFLGFLRLSCCLIDSHPNFGNPHGVADGGRLSPCCKVSNKRRKVKSGLPKPGISWSKNLGQSTRHASPSSQLRPFT